MIWSSFKNPPFPKLWVAGSIPAIVTISNTFYLKPVSVRFCLISNHISHALTSIPLPMTGRGLERFEVFHG